MDKENTNKFIASASNHIANINRVLKTIKLDVMADYVWQKPIDVTIVTNKVVLPSNIQIIENFIKNVENINSENIKSPKLSQLKSYLKIIDILYLIKNSDISISLDFAEPIIKSNHIFNNILLVSKL